MTETDTDILPIADLEPADDGADDAAGSRRSLPVLWITVAVILAIGLASVVLKAGSGDDRTPAERLAAAPTAVEDAKTFAYEVKAETSMGTRSNAISLNGVVDAAANRSRSTMDLLGQKLEVVTDGENAYVAVPAEARGLTQGKAWMKVPTAGLGGGGAIGGASPAANPLDSFRELAAPGANIEDLGKEDVRGTSTTHYRTRLDLSKKATGAGALAGDLSDVPVDVWLDENDRPLRYRVELQVDNPAQPGQKASVTTTIETFDYGKPVDVEVPAAGDVTEMDPSGLGSLFAPHD